MNKDEKKWVIVLDETLPVGIMANTATILGISLGKASPEDVGPDVADKSGACHPGIVKLPVPVLKADAEQIKKLRTKLSEPDYAALFTVDFSDTARTCHFYEEYMGKMQETETANLQYLGIGIAGNKKLINKLTGSLPLLR